MTTIKEVLINYMQRNGYKALYDAKEDCRCTIDDLIPCGCPNEDCAVIKKKLGCAKGGNTYIYCHHEKAYVRCGDCWPCQECSPCAECDEWPCPYGYEGEQ